VDLSLHFYLRFGPPSVITIDDLATGLQINNADEIQPTLHKAFDTAGPVLIGVNVDYTDNHIVFECVWLAIFAAHLSDIL
jgi:acetolactate synthase I/II/III large subunit